MDRYELGVYHNLRKLISVVDELRDVGLHQYIDLPRIVVVGTQSAGKSSVLEGIVGLDFLPRGEGVVTRRPLELRLVHLHDANERTHAIFENDANNEKIYEMSMVREKIEKLTDKVAGKNKGINDCPIVLQICGPQCPDLSLVDLPGITRVPLKSSDQTDDIETLTRDMAFRYVKDPRTIILAVIPANQDISTSDALQLARKVDPRGLRTIGVITKLDLMDKGTNAAKMILGEEIPLRLGYIAVKNRSQADINANRSVTDAVEEEMEFFKSNTVYRQIPVHHFGMKNLSDKLTKVLFRHIKNFLPDIKAEIGNKLRELKQKLLALGDGVPDDTHDKTQLVWSMINDYCQVFSNTVRGRYVKRLARYVDNETNTMYGGAQIRQIFINLLRAEGQGITAEMTDSDIDEGIRMHEGDSLPGFPTPDMFEYLILPHLQKLQSPVMDCLEQVNQSLDQLLDRLSVRVFARFPQLGVEVLEISRVLLDREKEKTKVIIENVINAETGYMFTNDDSYLASHASMLQTHEDNNINKFSNCGKLQNSNSTHSLGVPANAAGGPPAGTAVSGGLFSRENLSQVIQQPFSNWVSSTTGGSENKKTQYSSVFLSEMRSRLNAYFNIVLRNIRDTVPKTIGYFLVRKVQEALQFELYTKLSQEAHDRLLYEPDYITDERTSIRKQIITLTKATNVLQKDPTINTLATCNDGTLDDQFDWDLKNAGKEIPDNVMPQTAAAIYVQQTKPPIPFKQLDSRLFDHGKKPDKPGSHVPPVKGDPLFSS